MSRDIQINKHKTFLKPMLIGSFLLFSLMMPITSVFASNTPPTITLIGAPTLTVTAGHNFTDPGVTATDAEDGDLTSHVVITPAGPFSGINSALLGTTTVTYTVTDSGGLSASVTRQVVVVMPPASDFAPMYLPDMPACPVSPMQFGVVTSVKDLNSYTFGFTLGNDGNYQEILSSPLPESGSALDGVWIHPWGVGNYVQFDLNGLTQKIRVYPVQDHGPWPDEFNEYDVMVSTDRVTWVPATQTALYVNDINNVRTHDGVKDFVSSNGKPFRYVQIAPNGIAGNDIEIDAVQNCGVVHVNTPPTITLIGAPTLTVTAGHNFTDPGVTATDAEDGDLTSHVVKTGSVNTAVLGTYTLTYNVSDSQGLSATPVTRTVTVVAAPINHAPIITLIGVTPVQIIAGSTYADAGATATDIEDGNLTSHIVVTSNVNTAVPGSYTVTYNVSDSQGLAATPVTRIVAVLPPPVNHAPVITLVGVSPSPITVGTAYTDAGATATDVEDGDLTSHIVVTSNVNTAVPGSYTVTYNVLDSQGLAATPVTRIVAVLAQCIAPQITSPLTASAVKGQFLTYSITTAPATGVVVSVASSTLPSGMSFTPSTNTISGTPTQSGTFNIIISIPNPCGISGLATIDKVLVLTVTDPINTAPIITLVGVTPVQIIVGSTYTDAGATATDAEDGNLTSHIIATSTVNTAVPGSYTVTYNVLDSQGLAATPVTRIVAVLPPPATSGTITFCLLLTDQNNNLATSTASVPAFGIFSMNLASTTDIINSTIASKTWTSSTFSPNKKTILSSNDSDCYTVNNLAFGTYYYSPLDVTGYFWGSAKYNDQFNTTVNNIFDFSNYSPELFNATTSDDALRNFNSDGQVTLNSMNTTQTVYVLSHDSTPPPMCVLPTITSPLTSTAAVGTAYTYTFTATSTTQIPMMYSIGTSVLPTGLSFATTTGVISGTPTTAGTYTIKLTATNGCGQDIKNLVITVNPVPPPACTSNCGGGGGGGGNIPVVSSGGGGGGNGPIVPTHLVISNEKVVETVPGIAFVTWDTNMLATRRTVYGNASSTGTTAPNYGYTNSTDFVPSPALISHGMAIAITEGQTYYFRPVSTATTTNATVETALGKELVLNPAPAVANACYYLNDYLRKDFNNNPVEVKKLQVFLNTFEGASLTVNGVYDDATIAATNAFQVKYANETLIPWGHDGFTGTGYVYILTKKKVNEIYCNHPFPLTSVQQSEIDSYQTPVSNSQTNTSQNNTTSPSVSPASSVTPSNVTPGNTSASTSTPVLQNDVVGIATTSSSTPYTIPQTSTLTRVSHNVGNFALAFVSWPFHLFSRNSNQSSFTSHFSFWLSIILILIIGVILFLWYRQYKSHKTIENINKEIDLQK